MGVRSRRVNRHILGFKSGLCLRVNKGVFSSCRTSHILPKFRPSDGVGVLVRLGSGLRVIVTVDTVSVIGGGIEDSCGLACSLSAVELVSTFRDVKLVINDIMVARCGKRDKTSVFGGHLRGGKIGIFLRCAVSNCPSGIRCVMDSRNFNGGRCVGADEPVIIMATPNPNDNGVTAYLSRLCRRGGQKVGTNCTGFRAFPI